MNMTRRRTRTFPQFQRLPAEIRCLIWQFAVPDVITCRPESLTPPAAFPLPAAFHASIEARDETVKHSRLFLDAHHGDKFSMAEEMMMNPALRGLCQELRHIMLCQCVLKYNNSIVEALRNERLFPKLNKVYVITATGPWIERGSLWSLSEQRDRYFIDDSIGREILEFLGRDFLSLNLDAETIVRTKYPKRSDSCPCKSGKFGRNRRRRR